MEKFERHQSDYERNHRGHAFSSETLKHVESRLPPLIERSAETGCGKSTVLFSNLSLQHHVFCIDDTGEAGSSVDFYRRCSLTRLDRLVEIFGPTQQTLPKFDFSDVYDVVLLDGPHGFPFPELEYFYFYPRIKQFGVLVVDDVNIPSIGRMAEIILEDEMWDFEALIEGTLLLRRTDSPTFDPSGDGWWEQHFNRSRVSPERDIYRPMKSDKILPRLGDLDSEIFQR